MAEVKINVPPPDGPISLNVGDTLTIHAAKGCNFCCSIGGNFSPSIASITLSQGDNGPYTAETAGSGRYNTSDLDKSCSTADPTLTAKSVQINS